ncbi:hypothetical protein PC129_g25199, partial [Phytophthora cactorum]|uniref:Uncharacterized protein n=1 Tax=Phytophthora cactorum TaxID=29920 RepID=A0A8T0YWL4_9STRA|nr:hypothetical protein PC112_g25548 [Phytophthora cactorum]KAG2854096.1 hypothetical protein PC115_g25936 [Phytophthora cactorum]KAG2871317.1 hypothetical protein PC117_g28281 [Phytophthora cactorum]KAG3013229.1 hypothetical protein PC121_g25201 [Phytophthora cactorum]KAG3041109.1 hypothetical protein PC122_g25490 [Phytophthora cactorum]
MALNEVLLRRLSTAFTHESASDFTPKTLDTCNRKLRCGSETIPMHRRYAELV